jgi:hypothetical protein
MASLPNAELAILDIRKLEDYCLSPEHPRGRHKARVFRDALGIGPDGAQWLRDELLTAVLTGEAIEVNRDDFGARWRVDVPVARQSRQVVIRTIWMVRTGEAVPRFLTCWIL